MFTKDSFFVYSALSIVVFISNTYLYITWKQVDSLMPTICQASYQVF